VIIRIVLAALMDNGPWASNQSPLITVNGNTEYSRTRPHAPVIGTAGTELRPFNNAHSLCSITISFTHVTGPTMYPIAKSIQSARIRQMAQSTLKSHVCDIGFVLGDIHDSNAVQRGLPSSPTLNDVNWLRLSQAVNHPQQRPLPTTRKMSKEEVAKAAHKAVHKAVHPANPVKVRLGDSLKVQFHNNSDHLNPESVSLAANFEYHRAAPPTTTTLNEYSLHS